MPFLSSPSLQPAYSCGTDISIIDLDDDSAFISTLNVRAKTFVPRYFPIEDSSVEARCVDDILRTMHHLVSVHDSELEFLAREFAEADYPIENTEEALWLDKEEDLCGSLHMPARKPKGCTYGRKANRDGHQVRGSRHSREGHRAH